MQKILNLWDECKNHLRELPLFSRRSSASLVGRIVWLVFSWGIIVYFISLATIYWTASGVIQGNINYDAKRLAERLETISTPYYITQDEIIFESIEKQLESYSEVLGLRFYDGNGAQLTQYTQTNLQLDFPTLSKEVITKIATPFSEGALIVEPLENNNNLYRVLRPVVVRSLSEDNMLDISLEEQETEENIDTIGFIDIVIDTSIYQAQLFDAITQGIQLITALFLVAIITIRFVIKRSLRPLSDLKEPLKRLANGDINVVVESEGLDEEIATISDALNRTISALNQRDEELRKLIDYDRLTGLLNRNGFERHLDLSIETAKKYNSTSALLFIDLDHFKAVNDELGHHAGDRLLRHVGDLLLHSVRTDDIVARLGGDEYAIVAKNVDRIGAKTVADTIVNAIRDYIFIEDNKSFNVCASIGVCFFSCDQFTGEELLAQADSACHESKAKGKNQYSIYKFDHKSLNSTKNFGWSKRISSAIEDDGFVLHYQPVIAIQDGEHDFFEALIRLKDDDDRFLLPDAFLSTAERFGLSTNIDYWVIEQAFSMYDKQKNQHPGVGININISGQSFADKNLIPTIQQLAKNHSIDPSMVMFDIPEEAITRNLEQASICLTQLKGLGYRLCFDRFGTSLAAFINLQKIPVDYVKVFGGITSDASTDPVYKVLIKSIVEIATTFGVKVIAEHINSQEAMDFMRDLGITHCQGNWLGSPQETVKNNIVPFDRSIMQTK